MAGLVIALTSSLALGMVVLPPRIGGPDDAPSPDRAEQAAPLRLASACVRDRLMIPQAAAASSAPGYVIETRRGETVRRGEIAAGEAARVIVPLAVSDLAEGDYLLRLGAAEALLPFTVDRTAPGLLATDPPANSCPGDRLEAQLVPEGPTACGPVTCSISAGGKTLLRAEARFGEGGPVCRFDTEALAAADVPGWTLALRDAAGNESAWPLDWPMPRLTVSAPERVAPGEAVTATARAEPGGGAFEVAIIASEGLSPRIEEKSVPGAAMAVIRFTAPDAVQVVGLDVAYGLDPECPAARPLPAEILIASAEEGMADGLRAAPPPPLCGNGRIDPGETCDAGGPSAACDPDCSAPACGDGVVNPLAGEQCDDGNDAYGDACLPGCLLACGNGSLDGAEECDGGGETRACNLNCTAAQCGDGLVNLTAGETCDDGNQVPGDGCSASCRLEDDFEEERPVSPFTRGRASGSGRG